MPGSKLFIKKKKIKNLSSKKSRAPKPSKPKSDFNRALDKIIPKSPPPPPPPAAISTPAPAPAPDLPPASVPASIPAPAPTKFTKGGIRIIGGSSSSSKKSTTKIRVEKKRKKTKVKRVRTRESKKESFKRDKTDEKSDDTDDEPDSEHDENDFDDDHDYEKTLKGINIDKAKNVEDVIDKLEYVIYVLKKIIKKGKDVRKHKSVLVNVQKMLGKIKKHEAEKGEEHWFKIKDEIERKFKKEKKKLSKKVFKKTIDLTAPKEDRDPEVGVTLWKHGKDVVFKDKKYTTLDSKSERKYDRRFKKFNKLKHMNSDEQDKLDRKKSQNFNKYNVIHHHNKLLAYQQYNPMNYNGRYYY